MDRKELRNESRTPSSLHITASDKLYILFTWSTGMAEEGGILHPVCSYCVKGRHLLTEKLLS